MVLAGFSPGAGVWWRWPGVAAFEGGIGLVMECDWGSLWRALRLGWACRLCFLAKLSQPVL